MTNDNNFPVDPQDLTEEQLEKITITFAPGCFDSFEGTQEELDELIKEIQDMARSGKLFEQSRPIDIDEMLESDDPEDHRLAEKLLTGLDDIENSTSTRKLQ